MNWYKHFCNTTSDKDIMEAVALFGSDAFYVYHITLELLAKNDCIDTELCINKKVFKMFLPQIRNKKVENILHYYNKNNTLLFQIENKNYKFFSNKLSELSTRYTILRQKKVKKKCEKSVNESQIIYKKFTKKIHSEERRKKKERNIKESSEREALLQVFEKFWKYYPKKRGKQKALEAFVKHKPNEDELKKSLAWQVKSLDWTRDNGQYIPNPTTYLNQHRWKDEPTKTYSPKFVGGA